MKKIIFHSPVNIFSKGSSGDRVRPGKMYEAFVGLGYDVILCHGESKERRKVIKEILSSDVSQIAGIYSELSSKPIYFTDSDRMPRSLFLDFCFFKKLKKSGVPISFFYRDVHWLYEGETSSPNSKLKRLINKLFHVVELYQIKNLSSAFFVPSSKMLHKIPSFLQPGNVHVLPPGCSVLKKSPTYEVEKNNRKLALFYVGGSLPPLYDLSLIFSALKGLRNCVLTLCVREREWDSNYYNVPDNVRVVHLFGEEMLNEMLSSDVLIMVYPPVEYRDFAVPVKLYEAMGCGLPVIVSSHGEAAEIVRKEGVGWVVDDLVQLKNLLLQLSGDIAFRDDMRDAVGRAAQKNRWSDRASFVCEVLMAIKGG